MDISLYQDGEQATANVLNRPLQEIKGAVDYLEIKDNFKHGVAKFHTGTLTVGGRADTYYPVYIYMPADSTDGNYRNIIRSFSISRQYSQSPKPPADNDGQDYNGTHWMGLQFEAQYTGGAHDGGPSWATCTHSNWNYRNGIGDFRIMGDSNASSVIWLRGGNTIYNFQASDKSLIDSLRVMGDWSDETSPMYQWELRVDYIGWGNSNKNRRIQVYGPIRAEDVTAWYDAKNAYNSENPDNLEERSFGQIWGSLLTSNKVYGYHLLSSALSVDLTPDEGQIVPSTPSEWFDDRRLFMERRALSTEGFQYQNYKVADDIVSTNYSRMYSAHCKYFYFTTIADEEDSLEAFNNIYGQVAYAGAYELYNNINKFAAVV